MLHERHGPTEVRDDLTMDRILDRLIADLRARDRIAGDVARDGALGQFLIEKIQG